MGQPSQKQEEDEGVKKRDEWKYMCIRKDVAARLDRQRQKMSREIGFKLSWTKFFSMVSEKIEGLGKKAV